MASILEKVSLIAKGKLNDLLNKQYETPSALREAIRELEDEMEKLRSEATVEAGKVATFRNDAAKAKARVDYLTQIVQKLLASADPGAQTAAKGEAAKLVQARRAADSANGALDKQKEIAQELDEAVKALEAKHDEWTTQLHELESEDRSAHAEEHASAALDRVRRLSEATGSMNADNIAHHIHEESDIAREHLHRSVGAVSGLNDPEISSEADSVLAELKANMSAPAAK